MKKYPDVEKMTEIFNDLYKRFSIINKVENINFKDYINDIWNSFRGKKKDDQQLTSDASIAAVSSIVANIYNNKDEIERSMAAISRGENP